MNKKLFIKSYGCQMNVYDAQRMAEVIEPLGYQSAHSAEDADLIILNTCHIREKASEKVYSELGRLRQLKATRDQQGRRLIIGVAGCVAQAEGAEMMRRAPVIDMVFGPQVYHRLPDMVRAAEAGNSNILDTDFPAEDKFDHLPKTRALQGPAAFLTIQEGCDKFCTFCVVPYTRGAEYSRPAAKIVAEAEALAASGAREVTLLGQNVNAYYDGTSRLADLCVRLAAVDGLERIRYTTSHPRDMDDALINAHGTLDALMPYLHLPIQSGSDKILAAMNRQHTVEDYLSLVDRIRAARPDIALSSDFIVGFPGETEADFEATLAICETVKYAQAYSFKYSPRPGTPGAALDNQVLEDVKTRRLAALQAVISRHQNAFNTACVGQTMPVLLEKPGRLAGQLIGRSPWLQSVHLEAPTDLLGTIQDVQIDAISPNSLGGSLVTGAMTRSDVNHAKPLTLESAHQV